MVITTLGYALLSLLARRVCSGYDLVRFLKKPIGFFWHARHSQIYPELARLEEQGLVTSEVVEQRDRPDKRIYTITEAGRVALGRWVTEPMEAIYERSELVLRAYSVWLAEPEQAIKLFRAHEEHHIAQLVEYEQTLDRLKKEHGEVSVDAPVFGNYATLRRGIGYEREYAEWCRWMVEQLEQYMEQRKPIDEAGGDTDG